MGKIVTIFTLGRSKNFFAHDYVIILSNKMYSRGLALICKRMVNVFYYSDFIYQRSKDFQMEQKCNDAMDALPQKVSRLISYS